MSILISGSLVYDHIMNFPDSFKNHILPEQLHVLSVSFIIDTLQKSWGGTAGNIAYTMKLLGGEPEIVSAIGKDARDYLEHFASFQIDTRHISTHTDLATASAYITTDQDDNQITAFYPGPLSATADLPHTAATIALITPTYKGVMEKHLRQAAALQLTTVFDPGQQITAFSGEELQRMAGNCDIVIGNDYEIKLLLERTGFTEVEILKRAKLLITTLGEHGVRIATPTETITVPACPPQSVDDPTGAGDAFRAGFFFSYEQGLPLLTCAQVGCTAASYAIEVYGTQAHSFTVPSFAERYQKTYGSTLSFSKTHE